VGACVENCPHGRHIVRKPDVRRVQRRAVLECVIESDGEVCGPPLLQGEKDVVSRSEKLHCAGDFIEPERRVEVYLRSGEHFVQYRPACSVCFPGHLSVISLNPVGSWLSRGNATEMRRVFRRAAVAFSSPTVGGEQIRLRNDAAADFSAYADRVELMAYFRRRMAASDYDYPVGVMLFGHIGMVVVSCIAVAQRDGFVPPGWALLFGLVAATAPIVGDMLEPDSMRMRLIMGLVVLVATSLLLVRPPDMAFDFAPLVLVLMVGEVAAMTTFSVSVGALAAAAATLTAFAFAGDLDGVLYYLAAVVLGWIIGRLLLTQLRLLHQERAAQAIQAEQAATSERQRIAREVHDVVAHSLSVTLLHLTAARRALEQDRDIDEAVDALTDAERLGREAMADIRRTVGLLDAGPSSTRPEPTIADIPELVDDFRRAGLPVTFEMSGDEETAPGAIGLGIYRICQESLANIVKHAPAAETTVRLEIGDRSLTLRIDNRLQVPVTTPSGQVGSGLRGMRERVALLGGELRAGPVTEGWSVRARVPLSADSCSILRRIPGLA
jgi:signal transduction histidine kinase